MKIVYIATSIIPSRTANSIHVMKMCQAFAQNGHEVFLLVPDRYKECELGIVDVFSFYGVERCFEIVYIPLLPIKGKNLVFGFQAAQNAKQFKPDLVYGRDLAGCFFISLMKYQTIFESHAPVGNFIYVRMIKKLIKSSTLKKFVVITYALKNYYIEQYPFLEDKIFVAPDGADSIPNTILPVTFPNKGKKLQVGYVGHLYPGRGIEVIEQLAKRCPWADFHIIGGTDDDINSCMQLIKPSNNLIFQGYKPSFEAEKYRLGCDILLAPYQNKVSVAGGGNTVKWMSPLKVFEYMASGKAIICSDIPVLKEVLDHGRNAILCDPEDIDSWENALLYLYENETERIRIGDNAKSDLISNYTWYSRVQKILDKI